MGKLLVELHIQVGEVLVVVWEEVEFQVDKLAVLQHSWAGHLLLHLPHLSRFSLPEYL